MPEKRKILRDLSLELQYQIRRVYCTNRRISDLEGELKQARQDLLRAAVDRDDAMKKFARLAELI